MVRIHAPLFFPNRFLFHDCITFKYLQIFKKFMTKVNKSFIGNNLILLIFSSMIVLILSIIIFAYSFIIGILLWGLIVIFQLVFIWVFVIVAIYIREYIELSKKHIELFDGYLEQKIKRSDDEIISR